MELKSLNAEIKPLLIDLLTQHGTVSATTTSLLKTLSKDASRSISINEAVNATVLDISMIMQSRHERSEACSVEVHTLLQNISAFIQSFSERQDVYPTVGYQAQIVQKGMNNPGEHTMGNRRGFLQSQWNTMVSHIL